jgi:hypothetical protein
MYNLYLVSPLIERPVLDMYNLYLVSPLIERPVLDMYNLYLVSPLIERPVLDNNIKSHTVLFRFSDIVEAIHMSHFSCTNIIVPLIEIFEGTTLPSNW